MGRQRESRRGWLAGLTLAGALLLSGADSATTTSPADKDAEKLLASLNPDEPTVKAMAGAGSGSNHALDLRALLEEIQKRVAPFKADFLVSLPTWNDATRKEADDALKGAFTLQGVTGTAPRQAGGGFDWAWRGPNDDPEFAWFLNRQHHFPALFVAWRELQDTRYRTALNAQWRDWLRQNPRPSHYSFSSSWRALEVARRMEEAWMPILFAPEAGDALDDDVLAGLLADIPEHAIALRDTHSFSGNHLITEMTGLAALALAFPEFKDSPQWLDYALAHARAEAAKEIYPDGAETELSNLYQQVVLQELQRLVDMLAAADKAKELADMRPLVEKGWNFFAHTLDPQGHGPLDNDSSIGDDAALVRLMAAKYQRPDWSYIATNGKDGTAPPGTVSEYFPYAGLAVMRSGWDAKAQWAYFDMGPRGSDHQHADRLQLSLGGGGREFLVDDGRYNYQPGPWRDYFTGPRGHNVVLLDGQGTLPPPNVVSQPVNVLAQLAPPPATASAAGENLFRATALFAGNFTTGQGPAYHERSVSYHPGRYWLVTDKIQCAGAHKLEVLWHFHPDCTVKQEGTVIYTDDPGQANLGIRLVDDDAKDWQVETIKGRELPTPQGWYSPHFNERVPATCVSFTSLINHPVTITWVIWIVPSGQNVLREQPKLGHPPSP